MTDSPSTQPSAHSSPLLRVSREDAEAKLQVQIEKGRRIGDQPIRSENGLKQAQGESARWSAHNAELISNLFDRPPIMEEVQVSGSPTFQPANLSEKISFFRQRVDTEIGQLEDLRERLEIIPTGSEGAKSPREETASAVVSRHVFIVHGHDQGALEMVSRFLEKLGLLPVVLRERPNLGRTIIEKFEAHADAGFAVVILTPDDLGTRREEPGELAPRARQNVIFEFGFFIGKLGREKVCVLYKKDVEIPSDFAGVLYIPLEDSGAWRVPLAREMKQAGLDVDLNKVL
jgi:predicted nucleotide-binding protein